VGRPPTAADAISVRNVPVGAPTVVVTFVGYEAEQATVTVQAGATAVQDFQMTLQAVEGDEVIVVTRQRP